ncbi:hypothetical protein MBM_03325 [Drepanopeziza brunnea f. sp. 'multigermtubi' MB_m1]|uniref:Uncharacterized protein n=1 Tax=Marssonina brunnea f. sp. multigermtubi (strain MB_m1) TaxID=1072389 RepID=K1X038_MARBU|nr:uncharacterized protein MBM_03325 [Drepanopeziza brunnea f. sp. 'multigermtubi' MB_m1]EKD18332.1 hypothetical protein MBM_03325 [Drepanopeziza brunnea f. sp. 'multigermtubi' MB_m1]
MLRCQPCEIQATAARPRQAHPLNLRTTLGPWLALIWSGCTGGRPGIQPVPRYGNQAYSDQDERSDQRAFRSAPRKAQRFGFFRPGLTMVDICCYPAARTGVVAGDRSADITFPPVGAATPAQGCNQLSCSASIHSSSLKAPDMDAGILSARPVDCAHHRAPVLGAGTRLEHSRPTGSPGASLDRDSRKSIKGPPRLSRYIIRRAEGPIIASQQDDRTLVVPYQTSGHGPIDDLSPLQVGRR